MAVPLGQDSMEMATQVTIQIPYCGTVMWLQTGMIPSEVNIQILISFLSLSTALLDAERSLMLFAVFAPTVPRPLWRNVDCKQHLGAFLPTG